MTENECIKELKSIFKEILEGTGMLEIVGLYDQKKDQLQSMERITPDFIINVKTKDNEKYSLAVEVKSLGQPRLARLAVNQLQAYTSSKSNVYGVFGAVFVSPESKKICHENNIGFVDIAGNCFIKFNNIFLEIQGKPNPFPTTRPIKSLFSKRTTRAIRILLTYPNKLWTVVELAKEAKLSLGQTSNIKGRLLDFEFIQEKERKFTVLDPETLLNRWIENYNYKKNQIKNYYSLDETKEIEKKLADYCSSNNINYGFTLTSGASYVSPFLRYNRVFAYLSDSIEKIARTLDWKEVPSGPNVSLLEPYDESVLWDTQEIRGIRVVSDIQLFLDLSGYKGRGEEAAKFLYDNRLKNRW